MKASEAKAMSNKFYVETLMPEWAIQSKFDSYLDKICAAASSGSYSISCDVDSAWYISITFNDEQKKHGRVELKKRLQNLGYKVISDGIFSIAKISWK